MSRGRRVNLYRTGYSDDYRRQHEERLKEAEKEREAAKAENDRLRTARLKKLDDERSAKRREWEAKQDAQLEPAKAQHRRQWLYDHPDKTAKDFEQVWPLMRVDLLEEQRVEETAVYFRQAGYSEERPLAAARETINKRASGRA